MPRNIVLNVFYAVHLKNNILANRLFDDRLSLGLDLRKMFTKACIIEHIVLNSVIENIYGF
jgi:hypothetical protein